MTATIATHTPGPWATERPYGEPGLFVFATDPRCTMPFICRTRDTEEGEANARLIAAAPDLLEQLRRVLDQWHEHRIVGPTVYHDARAAIAEATIPRTL